MIEQHFCPAGGDDALLTKPKDALNDAKKMIMIGPKFAPYNPTNYDAVEIALTMLNIKEDDVLYDLGCGDGRLIIRAVQLNPSLHAVGVDYDLTLCEKSMMNITMLTLEDSSRTSVIHANVIDVDFSDATIIYIYLVPEGIMAIRDKLIEAINRGVRIVSYGM